MREIGNLTLPTDIDMVEETKELVERLGADAIRDCDGTTMPKELIGLGKKIYATYYTTRKDNEWARKNPEEVQQEYLITDRYTAFEPVLEIELLKGFHTEQLKVNDLDDPKRWWEVIDRTTGEVIDDWEYLKDQGKVIIKAKLYHEYTVSFLAFLIWDPVHMYNFITNDWNGAEHQITFDVRQPKTQAYVKEKLHRFCHENKHVDVIRFTTFFHQFTLTFDDQKREKYVEWFGYSASVSPYILEQFEKWAGYPFRAEYIVDQGYHNSCFRNPSKQFLDFVRFQQIEVCKLAKELVDIVHSYGKEAMMFLGDHWIGTEPYGEYFKTIGLDAVVGSVGDGVTLRMISDIKGVKYTEGRFLPYFFPDVFNENGDPIKEANENWLKARRAILRSPLNRMGYGGYLKLAIEHPHFIETIERIIEEFRTIRDFTGESKPYTPNFKVAILNSWGKLRTWMAVQVHHAIWHREIYTYLGVLECLSGMAFDVEFINFENLKEGLDPDIKVIINTGAKGTSWSGYDKWNDPEVVVALRKFVASGGGFIGIGEPSAFNKEGATYQASDILGIDQEVGYSLSKDKYPKLTNKHFIIEDIENIDFGENAKGAFATSDQTKILALDQKDVLLATNEYGKGRSVYMAGLPYNPQNAKLLMRSIYYAANKEDELYRYYATNEYVEVCAYESINRVIVINNTNLKQSTNLFIKGKSFKDFEIEAMGMRIINFD